MAGAPRLTRFGAAARAGGIEAPRAPGRYLASAAVALAFALSACGDPCEELEDLCRSTCAQGASRTACVRAARELELDDTCALGVERLEEEGAAACPAGG